MKGFDTAPNDDTNLDIAQMQDCAAQFGRVHQEVEGLAAFEFEGPAAPLIKSKLERAVQLGQEVMALFSSLLK